MGMVGIDTSTPKGRVLVELNELTEKTDKLTLFIGSENYKKLSQIQQDLLYRQMNIMHDYTIVLQSRLDNWE